MKRYSLFVAMMLAPPGVSNAHEALTGCRGFEAGSSRQEDADRIYINLAADIVRAALARDAAALTPLVAPDADFIIWRGDYSTSAREKGVAGAIEMAADLKAISFQSQTVSSGPISVTPSKCAWSVGLLWRTPESSRGVAMTFDFSDGRLIRARGDQVEMIEGDLR